MKNTQRPISNEVSRPDLKSEQGFTLIEILIAIVILAFLMTAVYTITVNSVETKDRVVIEDRAFMQVETALHRIYMDMSQIYSPLYYSVTQQEAKSIKSQMGIQEQENQEENERNGGERQRNENFPTMNSLGNPSPEIFNPDKGTLIFFTTANRRFTQDTKEANYAWVKYTVEENENPSNKEASKQLIRQVLADDPYTAQMDWKEEKKMVLLKNIKDFSFLFWEERTKKYVDSIRLLNENRHTIKAIKIRLVWQDDSNAEFTFERIMRPSWPTFDRKSDEADRWTEYRKNQNGNNPNGGPNGANGGINTGISDPNDDDGGGN